MRAGSRKRKRGFCGILTLCICAAAVFVLFVFFKDELLFWANPSGAVFSSEIVKKTLSDYVDPDARVIFAHYDGIEEDIDAYRDSLTETMTEEERRDWAEYNLQAAYLEEEIERALRNQERQICVVGWLNTTKGYVNNASGAGYDNSVFRTMPYSTFWLKSYEAYSGYLSAGNLLRQTVEEHCYVYTFTYYGLQEAEIQDMEAAIDREAEDILARIPEGADLWQTCRVIHDELVRRTEYDHDFGDHCHDLYGALVNHRAVCEGYALAFKYILNRTGEGCSVVVSNWDETAEATSHAWNQISAPTYERYIDVTWDDTGNTDNSGEPVVSYDYFGLTEEEISAVDGHEFHSDTEAVFAEPEIFNYYRHEGYLFSEYDLWTVTECCLRQYEAGSSCLTFRFDNEPAYREACAGLLDGGGLEEVLTYLDFYGHYWYVTNDDVCTISVGF